MELTNKATLTIKFMVSVRELESTQDELSDQSCVKQPIHTATFAP